MNKRNYLFYKMDIFGSLKAENKYDMPLIKPFEGMIPLRLRPFHEAMANHDYECTAHFYIDDPLFARILNSPKKYLPIMQRFQSVISPDFSQYVNFPYPLRLCNAYWNRALAAWWQNNGVNVIYNVTWSTPDSYEYSFMGLPHNTTIAINCSGIMRHNMSQYLWRKGYDEAVSTLHPSCIIRYGSVMPEEKQDISIYFDNEHLNRMHYGR